MSSMHLIPAFVVRSAIVSGAILLVSCASGPKLNPPSGVIGGISAAKSKVVVRQQQELKLASNISDVFPAGDYRPAFEDATGIYYEAPSQVIQKEIFLGMHVPDRPFTGGIYLERTSPGVAKIYGINPGNQGGEIERMLKGGRPGKPTVPRQPIQFQLTKS